MANAEIGLISSLPSFLKENHEDQIKDAVRQWSRLVAWSWTDIIALESQKDDEENLKKAFLQIVQKQGLFSHAYESYGNDQDQDKASELASDFKKLLCGDHTNIKNVDDIDIEKVKVTLSDVLEGLSSETYIFSKTGKEDKKFTDMFEFRVVTDYTGKIIEVEEGKKYVSLMAYPPCPVFSNATVTEDVVKDWARNRNTKHEYLPPSLYIPIAGC